MKIESLCKLLWVNLKVKSQFPRTEAPRQIHSRTVGPMDASGDEPTFEVINFLSKILRFSHTKDFCSLHIHGLYLYNTQGFIAE